MKPLTHWTDVGKQHTTRLQRAARERAATRAHVDEMQVAHRERRECAELAQEGSALDLVDVVHSAPVLRGWGVRPGSRRAESARWGLAKARASEDGESG